MRTRSGLARLSAASLLAWIAATTAEADDLAKREAIRVLIDDGRYVEAERESRTLLALAEPRDTLEVARALDLLAESLRRAGKIADPEARESASRALSIKERLLGPDDLGLGESLINVGGIAYASADYAEAQRAYERSLAIREKAFGAEHAKSAESLSCLGSALMARGDLEAARSTLERALLVRERVLGPDHADVAWTLMGLGSVIERTGDLEGARSLYERALAIRERRLRPDHPETARTLAYVGHILEVVGDYAGALGFTRRAYQIRAASLPPDDPDMARSLDGLGKLELTLGDYGEAGRLIERAMKILSARYGPEHPELAGMLMNVGWLAEAIGDYPEAERLYRRAVAIQEKALGADSPEGTWTLASLASVLHVTRRDAEARELLERASAIREAAYGRESPYVASALKDLARVTRALGDAERAEVLSNRAVAIYESGALGAEHPELGDALQVLADLLARRGDLDGALRQASRALSIAERTLGADHPLVADPLALVAELRLRAGEPGTAFDAALRVEELSRKLLVSTAGALAERQALRHAATRPSGLDIAFSVAAKTTDASFSRRAWEALIRSRALVLDEIAARHQAFRRTDDPGTRRLLEEWERASERLANLMVRGAMDLPTDHYARMIQDARREKERTERALGEASRAFRRDRARKLVDGAQILRSLPRGSAVVGYARYLDRGSRSGSAPHAAPVPSYLAFVIEAGKAEPAVVSLGPASRVETLVQEWRRWASRPPSVAEASVEQRATQAGDDLRRAIWDPVEPHLAGADVVFVVPDFALQLVNLAALPRARGGYLVEGAPRIHYLSAERDIVVDEAAAREAGTFLAFGDPAYDDGSPFAALQLGTTGEGKSRTTPAVFRGRAAACPDFADVRFDALPGTRAEVNEIATVWRAPNRDGVERSTAAVLLGAGATETEFKRRASGARVLHLATHGYVEAACTPSAAPVRGIGKLVAGQDPSSPGVESPLRLSGLAFAGANRRSAAEPDEDDGVLSAEEIASIDLSGVEWAVLSACDTGLGELQAGEGVLGLRRAFQVAGVGTVIMSLWAVDDESTRRWMRALYDTRIHDGQSTASAVREASLRVLRERREARASTRPFYWASFIAAGDWR